MATISVLVWQVTTSYTGSWSIVGGGSVTIQAGNYLHVLLDDVADSLSCDYTSASVYGMGSNLGTLTQGPNLFYGNDGAATIITPSPYYQYCDGTTLRKVVQNNQFPYGSLDAIPGAAECAIAPVCDLDINPFYSYDNASGPSTPDGFLTVFASSSNGTIKFALNDPDFDYATEGQTSGTFNNLYAGVYTVYAKDAIGCQDQKTIEIKVTTVYGVKYRLEFQDTLVESGLFHRTDILERAYSGAITEICGGDDPVHIIYNGDSNDPTKSIIPSEFRMQILKESAGEFEDLFTDDDKKFLIRHYVNTTNNFTGIPIHWTGYVLPEFHNEPFIFEPFNLDITATDQIGDFQNIKFKDENDNLVKGDQKAIKIIAIALKLTGLSLNIRCGINIFEEDMTVAATDDPLDQAYIDTRIFLTTKDEPLNCKDVLDRILAPFGSRIFQSKGYWWIVRMSDAVGTFDYREFDVDGDFVSNSSFVPTQNLKFPSEINRAAWASKSGFLSHYRNYGYFSMIHNLGKDNNLIDEGRFEEEDIENLGSGNQFFKNWNFLQAQAGVSFGFENVINGDSKGAFYADFELAQNAQVDNKLYSIEIPLPATPILAYGFYKIRFQYFIQPRFGDLPYIRLGWSVKVTDGTQSSWMINNFPPNNSRPNNTDELINEIYVTNFNQWNTFELTSAELKNFIAAGTLQVTFYMHNHYGRDFSSITNLKTFSISGLDDSIDVGRKVMVAEGGKLYVYTSSDEPQAESLPDIVRPNDYNNDFVWVLDKIYNLGANIGLVKKFLIDNVSVSYFPRTTVNNRTFNVDPPETLVYDEEVSTFNKSNFEKTFYLGDMIRFVDSIEGVSNSGYEENERLIYRGYFRFSNGTPTRRWARQGVLESKRLLQITLEDYREQFRKPQRKLSGTFISDIVWHFVNSVQEFFEGSRYQFLTMDFDAKNAMYTIDIIQVGTGAGGEPPVITGAFSNAYSDDYEHVE